MTTFWQNFFDTFSSSSRSVLMGFAQSDALETILWYIAIGVLVAAALWLARNVLK